MSTETLRAKSTLPTRWRLAVGDYVSALEVSCDGRRCVVGSGGGEVLGIDATSGLPLFRQLAHPGGVLGISLESRGARFITCGQDVNAKLWTAAGDVVRELPGGSKGWVEHVAWAPDGARIATAAGRTVRVWSGDGDPLVESEPLESTVSGLAWRSDGGALAATCYGGVHILPLVEGVSTQHLAWKGLLISIAWSPDASVIACGSQDASVHFWRLKSGQDSEMSGYPFKPKALAWDHDSKLLATSGDATVMAWDFRGKGPEGTRPIELAGHQGVCTRLTFSPRKSVLASGSRDRTVLLWEPRRRRKPVGVALLEDEITALGWHPAHHTLIGADASGNVAAWEVG